MCVEDKHCLLIQIKNQSEIHGKYEALEDTLTLSNKKSKKGSSAYITLHNMNITIL